MKIRQMVDETVGVFEGLHQGEYYVWGVEFTDGTTANVRIRWDETSKADIEKHFGKPVAKINHDFSIHSADTPAPTQATKDWHADNDRRELARAKSPGETLPRFNEGDESLPEGKWVKGPGGVALDRQGNPKVPKAPTPKAPKVPAGPKRDENGLTDEDYGTVWRKIEEVVGQIFPDGDPIDWIAPWLKKKGVSEFRVGEVIDKACKKNGWDDMYAYYNHFKDGDYGFEEGMMGGINRCAPAVDVSYEKVLDEALNAWDKLDEAKTFGDITLDDGNISQNGEEIGTVMRSLENGYHPTILLKLKNGFTKRYEVDTQNLIPTIVADIKSAMSQQVNELSVTKMTDYKDAAGSDDSIRKRPLRKLAKSVQGVSTADRKINAKVDANSTTRRQGPQRTYEDRLQDFI